MKRIILCALLFTATLVLGGEKVYALNANDIIGLWYIPEDSKGRTPVADVFQKNGKFYAYAFAYKDLSQSTEKDVNNPNVALRNREMREVIFVYDLTMKGDKLVSGEIYNPDEGKFFHLKGKLSKDKNTITWKASIDGAGLFGKTIVWKRVTNPSKYITLKPNMSIIEKNIPRTRQK